MTSAPPTIVLADLHLSRSTPPEVGVAFARLLDRHAGARVIVAGDLFDLATGRTTTHRRRAVAGVLCHHAPVRAAVGRHLDRCGELWLAPGNHDPDLGGEPLREALLDAVGPSPLGRRRVRSTPWFFRLGALHVEHGHVYDPDNAPAHPLVVGTRSLGTHFCLEFMYPTRAYDYLITNDQTPGKLLLSAFQRYGRRGPYVVYRYFYAAALALLRSGRLYRGRAEPACGRRRLSRYAAEAGVDPELVERLCRLTAAPTLESSSRTFARLYLDRALATAAVASGLTAAVCGARRTGPLAAAAGAAALLYSWQRGHDRYRGSVSARLAAAAERVAEATGAELVVFGHAHREDVGSRYANTGSFAHPRPPCEPGRPYLEIQDDGAGPRAVRRRLVDGPP